MRSIDRRFAARIIGAFIAIAASSAYAAPAARLPDRDAAARHAMSDFPKHPMIARQQALRTEALQTMLRSGRTGRVARAANGQFVELEQTRHDRIFVLLVEFGSRTDPSHPGNGPGPRHNEIPEPDRNLDNFTLWAPDFSRAYFEDLIFRQMRRYYHRQSGGRYDFSGEVTPWVKVPYNEARYGQNTCGSIVCHEYSDPLIEDGLNAWYAMRIARGDSAEEIRKSLQAFDQWDRYDHDLDGNFDEPDGYIDHLMIVHAGIPEETEGGAQGADAIWSHRSYAFGTRAGGPPAAPFGGAQVGDTGIWAADYTMQGENSGLGVFAHEFGHDLGLPDAYDYAGVSNSVEFWTLMGRGSYTSLTGLDIGSYPTNMSAWDKLQLGWLTYDVAQAATHSEHRLGPADSMSGDPQALLVNLPDRERLHRLGVPPEGELAWWGGMGDYLDNSMTRSIRVPRSRPVLSMRLWWDIELDYDYAYVSVSTDGGTSWTHLASDVTTNDNPNGTNEGNGITGSSGGAFVPVSFDLSPWAGQTVLLQLRYWTDYYTILKGIQFDDIRVGGFRDGAEDGENGWELDGFVANDGRVFTTAFNAYLAEYRQYLRYDAALEPPGPYYFSALPPPGGPYWKEQFPYQEGLLIWYWDGAMQDNGTSAHPGEALIMPVDAHPQPLLRPDGVAWDAIFQTSDAPFGLKPTLPFSLRLGEMASDIPSQAGVSVFDDTLDWRFPIEGDQLSQETGIDVPNTGTRITVESAERRHRFFNVTVDPSP